jgi:hypothetical protein
MPAVTTLARRSAEVGFVTIIEMDLSGAWRPEEILTRAKGRFR